MRVVWMLVGVALLAQVARADKLKVPKDFDTIQAAVDAAQPEDIIIVSKGTYEPFTVSKKSDITIKGKGKPLIDAGPTGPCITIDGSTDITLIGLTAALGEDDGIVVTDSEFVSILKCRIENVDGVGVSLAGSSHFVEKCRFTDTGDNALSLEDGSENIFVDKNRFIETNGAMSVHGDGHTITRNKIKDSGDEGISLVATNCLVIKNRFNGVDDDALDVEGDDNWLLLNKAKNIGSNGVEVSPAAGDPFVVTGNLFEKNKMTGATDNGFFVHTAGNTFIKNKATKSGAFDLFDDAGEDANIYEKNKFPNEHFE